MLLKNEIIFKLYTLKKINHKESNFATIYQSLRTYCNQNTASLVVSQMETSTHQKLKNDNKRVLKAKKSVYCSRG